MPVALGAEKCRGCEATLACGAPHHFSRLNAGRLPPFLFSSPAKEAGNVRGMNRQTNIFWCCREPGQQASDDTCTAWVNVAIENTPEHQALAKATGLHTDPMWQARFIALGTFHDAHLFWPTTVGIISAPARLGESQLNVLLQGKRGSPYPYPKGTPRSQRALDVARHVLQSGQPVRFFERNPLPTRYLQINFVELS